MSRGSPKGKNYKCGKCGKLSCMWAIKPRKCPFCGHDKLRRLK